MSGRFGVHIYRPPSIDETNEAMLSDRTHKRRRVRGMRSASVRQKKISFPMTSFPQTRCCLAVHREKNLRSETPNRAFRLIASIGEFSIGQDKKLIQMVR